MRTRLRLQRTATTVGSEDKLYHMGMKNWTPVRRNVISEEYNLQLLVVEDQARPTVTVLVMHLLLVRVLEGFAVTAVSV